MSTGQPLVPAGLFDNQRVPGPPKRGRPRRSAAER